MSRYAVASKAGAYLAGSQGQPPSSRIGAQTNNAVPVAGVTAYDDWEAPSDYVNSSCSVPTLKGEPCKGRPLGESDKCVSHTKKAE
jgi:hypothetical protein